MNKKHQLIVFLLFAAAVQIIVAVQFFKRNYEEEKQFFSIMKNKAVESFESGNYNAAINLYTVLIDKDEELPDYFLKRGVSYQMLGIADSAMHDFDQLIELQPESEKGYYLKGNLYSIQKNYPEAVTNLKKAISINSGDAGYHYALGVALFKWGKKPESESHFVKAHEMNPDIKEINTYLGIIAYEKGDKKKAEEYLSLNPDSEESVKYLGLIKSGK
ncbi:MAG: tetratricopeptide repeat protein [Ignavibacteriaceae bacterium]|nr:tetratricopeptide repeat protein [Ignavibacteriaceae bacterium]NUM69829.1 tetratricopeptide repeat protein [Ignavibacteriaceae bacterium]